MTLRQLRYLLAVVDNGMNITAAADSLYTSQPGMSRQLRQLEDEIGVPVFSRKGRVLTGLTPAGTLRCGRLRLVLEAARGVVHP